jgi:hypothetical protein
MKKSRYPVGACLAVALLAGGVLAAEGLKSGPQVGDQLPGLFHPLNVTGASAGQRACQL